MAANLNGNAQTYQPFAIRIFQGLKPDVVAIQEFNYGNNTPADFRSMLDTAFGTDFSYFRETNGAYSIPNGVISRYPILAAGSWVDTVQSQPNRGFAWAQIALPGTNDLYVVSVHLLSSAGATARASEAANLQALIQANFPSNAWIVLAGDLNTDSRSEAAVTTLRSFLSDNPIPTDAESGGNSDTSVNRNHPYDYVLPSFSLTNLLTAAVFTSHSYLNGLVFDSRVYTPLGDVAPILYTDSSNAQHMAVLKDFQLIIGTNASAPVITTQPQSQTVSPGSSVTFRVSARGSGPLAYQWWFNGTDIPSAVTNLLTLSNVQFTDAGTYFVIVTNLAGSATSSVAVLTVTNLPPSITSQPQGQTVYIGASATFSVTATGAAPLSYQWRFSGTNIAGANTNIYTRDNIQTNDAGSYLVVITNVSGTVTSAPAVLTVINTNQTIIAQWNFNSILPDGATTTGSTSPSIGTGTASLVGGATATFASGDTALDPAGTTDNSGWNTTTYPAQGTGNKSRGAQFTVSTAGRQNIVISWSSQSSNTGSKYGRLQYSTNGIDFADCPSAFVNGTSFTAKTNSLGTIAGVNDNSNFAIRLVSEFDSTANTNANDNFVAAGNSSSYAGTGTMRYDMVTVYGAAIITSTQPIPATLNASAYTTNGFQLFLTGAAGSNYIMQTSDDLATTNWISLLTNASPFTFVDTNAGAFTQRFYRALALP